MPIYYLLACLIGLGTAPWLPSEIQYPTLFAFGVSSIVIERCGRCVRYQRLLKPTFTAGLRLLAILSGVMGSFTLGLAVSVLRIDSDIRAQLPKELELNDLAVTFTIVSVPEKGERNNRFAAQITSIACPEDLFRSASRECGELEGWRPKVRLSWYSAPELTVGDEWQATVRLRRPRGLVNFSGFDYQAWLLQQGIRASGYIRSKSEYRRVSSSGFYPAERLRQLVALRFDEHDSAPVSVGNTVALIRALAYGDKSRITSHQWSVLNRTGTVHLMAISGLHIGLAAVIGWSVGLAIQKLFILLLNIHVFVPEAWRRFLKKAFRFQVLPFNGSGLREVPFFRLVIGRVCVLAPSLCSIWFSVCYAALSGFAIPTQRALLMVVAVHLAFVFGKRVSPSRVLLVTALAVLLFDPYAFLSQGFWLSFGAVAVLFFALSNSRTPQRKDVVVAEEASNASAAGSFISSAMAQGKHWLYSLVKMQGALFLGLFVPLLLVGQSVSFVSPVANLIAVPAVSFLVVPLIMLAMFIMPFVGGKLVLLSVTEKVLSELFVFLEWLAHLDSAIPVFDRLGSPQSLWCFSLGVLLLLSNKQLGLRVAGLGFCLVALSVPATKEDHLTVSVLDVGQGLAVLVASANNAILYDTGAAYSASFDMGARVILPILRHQNISELDALIVSHSDNDHAGGARAILQGLPISTFIVSHQEETKTLDRVGQTAASEVPRSSCYAGKQWQFGELRFESIWPLAEDQPLPKGVTNNPNNHSCVLLLYYRESVVLLPGDIDKSVERYLTAEGAIPQTLDLVVAAHHGSKTSSGADLIKHTKILWSVFSSGYKNRYNHPSDVVVNRFERAGVHTLNTASSGAVTFRFTDHLVEVKQARRVSQKRWIE